MRNLGLGPIGKTKAKGIAFNKEGEGHLRSGRLDIADIILASVVIAIALASFLYTFTFPSAEQEMMEVGPSLFPRLISVTLILLSSSLLMITLGKNILREKSAVQEEGTPRGSLFLALIIFSITIGYVILMYFFGFFISTIVFFLSIGTILEADFKKTVLFAVGITGMVFFMFQILLRVPLPKGTLFGGL